MDDWYAENVGTPVTSTETVDRDLTRSSIKKTGEKTVQPEEGRV
jgi:hypothetical protein